ncbi:hypothetical protein [Halalkalibacter okhensis]|uniref:KARI N-terminal Rossmann domain-containing protein n=1 Tax=Halalkalibacter okhensis TaxID=333138 RepID=A0A0B0IEY0_9BACI|nr:hypothetical protein [Halalkalibacter okhensis]KHF38634.1 hypothetical protein LQ50_20175 [Halalkalibacter okhensis]
MIENLERKSDYYSYLKGKKVAILGYDEAAREEIDFLLDNGVEVVVGLRRVDDQWSKVEEDGFVVKTLEEAVEISEIIQVW